MIPAFFLDLKLDGGWSLLAVATPAAIFEETSQSHCGGGPWRLLRRVHYDICENTNFQIFPGGYLKRCIYIRGISKREV